MKAAVLRDFKTPLTVQDVSVPKPSESEVLIKVEVCGVCHSDLHVADGDWSQLAGIVKRPLILGHEVVGTIVEAGSAVRGINVGDRVGVPWIHYVFDLWVEAWRKKVAKGDVIVVRYADDLVVGFENRAEAERFLKEFRERLAKFGLELHAEKTRLIEFGQFAERNRKRRGEAKPETFTFLGFTHSCGKRRGGGSFIV